ncbi:phosphoenolpyruvate carboxylase [Bdellovibrio sp. BCCA]|uniref:phosphoenolpyruvate carboxylase n=1 Tax=Bdellovibrio sp. BCCA TaxID=3136281 RepID=UPI0030F03794
MTQTLPKELTSLVDWSVSELGRVIESELGTKGFQRIENIRRYVKSDNGQSLQGLLKLKKDLASLSSKERYDIAHSFSLMLELINACEAAYRTFRLKEEFKKETLESHRYGRIIHVLTAHPTESRNPDIIYYFKKIQTLLEKHLDHSEDQDLQDLHVLIKWVWRIPMSKQRKPSVMDEAEYIYSLALQKDILDVFIQQRKLKLPFYIRTWVGGDKDGHPGVDEKTMLGSLQMARGFLLEWIHEKLRNYFADLEPLAHSWDKKKVQALILQSKKIRSHLTKIQKIRTGDSHRVHALKQILDQTAKTYKSIFTVESPSLFEIRELMKIFPGLVVPLELREDSSLVHESLKGSPRKYAISRMLKALAQISPQHDPRFYVRGFVLSHTESAQDIIAGISLAERFLGKARLPIVPLFESANALESGVSIIEEFLKSPQRRQLIQKYWSKKLEVMVGYSDSAKENGSFPSRFLIHSALERLEAAIKKHGLVPIFFHGSGGSVERGGGSVQEQTEWWPESALATVKATVQGEMIYRNYTSPEILLRQLERFAAARDQGRKKVPAKESVEKDLQRLSDFVQNEYREILKAPHFLELIEWATPYSFMKDLRMGSRPSKRQGAVDLTNLRAIPWVLCWTQTRALFPSWWGVGSFWQTLSSEEKSRYQKAFAQSSLFRSYIKVLGFTLEKIELDIFAMYLHSSRLPKEVADSFVARFEKEFAACKKAVHEITGEKSLLWYRPWLETSISLRSPLIHPLNVLQLLALQDKDILLLRETVTGIASGMLTTG